MSSHSAIATFCESLGIPLSPIGLSLPLALEFERSGTLRLEENGAGGYWLTLAREVPLHRRGVAAAVLRAAHPDRSMPLRVKAGFHGDETLVLMTGLAKEVADAPAIASALRMLVRLADEVDSER
ncbi:chaperone protein sycN [Hyphomicrobium sp. MC1]|uniref:chaperone protein sycN n=1 Tax=Hyphomicrobium sp. (strain MC1) TaxID=717785 RepID=UPI000213F22F|nr:chaperone protein sycN [Hyphomicrobium sp. MC1]CCB66708.1 Chaperone protein sycN [Hyphomicrobium sp. MC1]